MGFSNTKKRRRKRKLKVFFRTLTLIGISFFFIVKIFSNYFRPSINTMNVVKETYESLVDGEAIIVRDEELVNISQDGYLVKRIEEGERVSSGQLVASVNKGLSQDLEKKLEVIEYSINNFNKLGEEEGELDLLKNIQKEVLERDYTKLYRYKDRLDLLSEAGEKDEIKSLEELKDERNRLSQLLDQEQDRYYSNRAAIVSYQVDGFENSFDLENLDKVGFKDFDREDKLKDIKAFKLVDNFNWAMVIRIDKEKKFKKYDVGSPITVKINDNKITGTVISIEENDKFYLIRASFNNGFEEIREKRKILLDIVNNIYIGYRIPRQTMIEWNGKEGVFTLDLSGIVRFKAVKKIHDIDESYILVSSGDHNFNIDDGESLVETITIYDQIIIEPKDMEDGKIIE